MDTDKALPIESTATTDGPLAVVGVGASAGGLEALQALFTAMPIDTGLAFVVVTHQHADQADLLPDLLRQSTRMPVVTAVEALRLQANCLYICPPGQQVAFYQQGLHCEDSAAFDPAHLPIDGFFNALAERYQAHAIGIVLSGNGADGASGLQAIKAVGGVALVQRPESAKFDSMPASAIAHGAVDAVLLPEQMADYLKTYCAGQTFDVALDPDVLVGPALSQAIFSLLRQRTGHDFADYKPTTLKRRIARRMNIHRLREPDQYLQFLQENPVEVDALFKELLINVTRFFRDEAVFEALVTGFLPPLLADKPDYYELRVWVAGCSTGEEAYSLAILLREAVESSGRPLGFKVFATDLDESAIRLARYGLYPAAIEQDVSGLRLQRFFSREGNHYRISRDIRDRVIFATQNLIQDPPFTRMDVISCRNVLIYLSAVLQKRIIPQFHYSLNAGGLLVLGLSESISHCEDKFDVVDKKNKIFRRSDSASVFSFGKWRTAPNEPPVTIQSLHSEHQVGSVARQVDRLLLQHYAPTCLLINDYGKLLFMHGDTERYLQNLVSPEQWTIADMLRDSLRSPLLAAFNQLLQSGEQHRLCKRLTVDNGHVPSSVDVSITRLFEPEALRDLFLVAFLPREQRRKNDEDAPTILTAAEALEDSAALEKALMQTQESLQQVIEQLQLSNEEIKSTNEELQSTNEELQSSNEELETAKEEMQSLNDELNATNYELNQKLEALTLANADMQNLLNSLEIAVIYLDSQFNIRRFTQKAQTLVRLIDSDIGRPLADLVTVLHYPQLLQQAQTVLSQLQPLETLVQTETGDQLLLRILPYRNPQQVVDGVVMTFVDVCSITPPPPAERPLMPSLTP